MGMLKDPDVRVQSSPPGPPEKVEVDESRGSEGNVKLRWDPPRFSDTDNITSYKVKVQGDVFDTSEHHFAIQSSPKDVCCKVSVAAVNAAGVGAWVERHYVVEIRGAAFVELKRKLKLAIQEFRETHPQHEHFLAMLIGKQHHGKSSLINHLSHCLKQQMDIGDEVETGPASEFETTVATNGIKVPFDHKFSFTLLDTPAFSALGETQQKQLQDLLTCAKSGWKRGSGTISSICPWLSEPPNGVIAVVSLQAWRDERDEVKDYFATLQGILKHGTQNDVAFPYIPVATHKDVFVREAGNHGDDPLVEIEKAEKDLRTLANTTKVYCISNYVDESEWLEKNTENTYRCLRDLVKLAKNSRTDTIDVAMNQSLLMVVAALFLFLAAVAKLFLTPLPHSPHLVPLGITWYHLGKWYQVPLAQA